MIRSALFEEVFHAVSELYYARGGGDALPRAFGEITIRSLIDHMRKSAEIFASHKQIQIYCIIQLLKNQAEIFQPADDGFFVNR